MAQTRYLLAQATVLLSVLPKSNAVTRAWNAAMEDVLRHGSLPVPNHLRSANWRERRDFGTGKGYLYPHDFEGHDVEQQYLPDKLAGRRYYEPTEEGQEKVLKDRMEARRAKRAAAANGGPQRGAVATGKGGSMSTGDGMMRSREEAKRRLADRQKRDASDPVDESPRSS